MVSERAYSEALSPELLWARQWRADPDTTDRPQLRILSQLPSMPRPVIGLAAPPYGMNTGEFGSDLAYRFATDAFEPSPLAKTASQGHQQLCRGAVIERHMTAAVFVSPFAAERRFRAVETLLPTPPHALRTAYDPEDKGTACHSYAFLRTF